MSSDGFQSISDLFGNHRLAVPQKKRASERGTLLEYFSAKTGREIGHIVPKLTGLKQRDLYYIKSAADSYEREGKGSWSKAFFGMLKVRP